jgi:hypothetical protein
MQRVRLTHSHTAPNWRHGSSKVGCEELDKRIIAESLTEDY